MWVFYAFIAAILNAVIRMTNQNHNKPGLYLAILPKVLCFVILIPASFFVEWPTSPWFYIFTLIQAPLVVYFDTSLYSFVAKYGAGAFARIETLMTPIVFVSWWVIVPAEFFNALSQPAVFLGSILCLTGIVFFTMRLSHCEVNGKILRAMLPLVLSFSVVSLLLKGCADLMPTQASAVVFLLSQTFFVLAIGGGSIVRKLKSGALALPDKKTWHLSVLLAIYILVFVFCRLLGFRDTSNPGYVTAIMLTAPFWVSVGNKIIGHKETVPMRDGMGLVLSACALALIVG